MKFSDWLTYCMNLLAPLQSVEEEEEEEEILS